MADDLQPKKKLQTERGGYGEGGGGRIKTALDLWSSGEMPPMDSVFRPMIGLCLHNARTVFALNVVLSPVADVMQGTFFEFHERKLKVRIPFQPDIMITDFDSLQENPRFLNGLFDGATATADNPAVLLFLPTHIAGQYYSRFSRAGLFMCLHSGGPDSVLTVLNQFLDLGQLRHGEEVYDAFHPIAASDVISPDDAQIVCRLDFPDDVLCAELQWTSEELSSRKRWIFNRLKVENDDEAKRLAKGLGIEQLAIEPVDGEEKKLENKEITVIAKWLAERLVSKS